MTPSQIRFALLALCSLFFYGCGKNEELVFHSQGGKATFEIYLNSEPIYCGDGRFITSWSRHPINKGSNQIVVVARPTTYLEKYAPSTPNLIIGVEDHKGGRLIEEIEYEKELAHPVTNVIVIKDLNSNAKTEAYDSLINTPQSTLEAEAKQIILKYVDIFIEQGPHGLTNVFEIQDPKIFEHGYSHFVEAGGFGEQFKIERVKTPDDLRVIIGQHFILVAPSQRYKEANQNSSLFKISDTVKNFSTSQECFVLAKKQSDWFAVGRLLPAKFKDLSN